MLTKNEYKKDFITRSGYVIGGVWVLTLIIGIIFVGISFPFPYWWTILLILPVNLGLYIWHIILTQKIILGENFETNIKILRWLSFLQILVLNLPLFAYGLIGSVFYTSTHYSL